MPFSAPSLCGAHRRGYDGGMTTSRAGSVEGRFKAAAEIARRFPGVEVSTSYRTPAMKVKGKFMARLRTEAEGWLAIKCDFASREMLLQAAPHVFHLTPHYENYPMILVDLAAIDDGGLAEVIERAWRMTASDKLVRDWDAQHAAPPGGRAPGARTARKRRPANKRAVAR